MPIVDLVAIRRLLDRINLRLRITALQQVLLDDRSLIVAYRDVWPIGDQQRLADMTHHPQPMLDNQA